MENQDQILLLLGEIKGQIGGFIASLADVNKRTDNHEERIRTLETKTSKQSGIIAGITIAASAVATIVGLAVQYISGK